MGVFFYFGAAYSDGGGGGGGCVVDDAQHNQGLQQKQNMKPCVVQTFQNKHTGDGQ